MAVTIEARCSLCSSEPPCGTVLMVVGGSMDIHGNVLLLRRQLPGFELRLAVGIGHVGLALRF